MKALRNVTLGIVGLAVGYYMFGYAWVLFWDVLMKIFTILQTVVMVAIVMTAIYVLWNMLSYKSTKERDY